MTLVAPVRPRLPLVALLLSALGLLGAVVGESPAAAAGTTVPVTLCTGGAPSSVTLHVGDQVRFVNGETTPSGCTTVPPLDMATHRVTSTTGGWSTPYDSGALKPGDGDSTPVFGEPGTYYFTDTRTSAAGETETFQRNSLVVAAGSTPSPTPSTPAASSAASKAPAATKPSAATSAGTGSSAKPTASAKASKAPEDASARNAPGGSPSPQPTGGTGVALRPQLGSQPLSLGGSLPAAGGPAPSVAPPVSDDPALLLSQSRGSAGVATAASGLEGPDTGRRYGIPVVLALVALLGVTSLVVRVLLAEPLDRLPGA